MLQYCTEFGTEHALEYWCIHVLSLLTIYKVNKLVFNILDENKILMLNFIYKKVFLRGEKTHISQHT